MTPMTQPNLYAIWKVASPYALWKVATRPEPLSESGDAAITAYREIEHARKALHLVGIRGKRTLRAKLRLVDAWRHEPYGAIVMMQGLRVHPWTLWRYWHT